MTTSVQSSSRDLSAIIEEAANIGQRLREAGRHTPKDPFAVARLVALYEESGLGVLAFCEKTRATSTTTMHFWTKGKSTSGKDWPALAAALAKRNGAAMANVLNAGLGVSVEAPPSAPQAGHYPSA